MELRSLKRKAKIITLAIGLRIMLPSIVQAAYVRYNLPVYGAGGNYYGSTYNKQTDKNYITNNIISDHNSFTALNCWVGNENGTGIGDSVKMKEGETKNLYHWKVNRKVKLVFENAGFGILSGEVTGRVDHN